MAKIVETKKGVKIVLRNPAEKAKRFARQLKTGVIAETGAVLTQEDRKYRMGYLTSRGDSAKAYCAKNGYKSKAKPYKKKQKQLAQV